MKGLLLLFAVVLLGNFNSFSQTNTFLGTSSGSGSTGLANSFYGYYSGVGSLGSMGVAIGSYARINTGSNSSVVGYNSTSDSGIGNSILGSSVYTNGNYNVHLGYSAGYISYGSGGSGSNNNVFLGSFAGSNTTSVAPRSNNVFIGHQSGQSNVGSGNIFLGYNSGMNETGSNKLYIANSGTSTPLIYGDFDSGNVGLGTNSPSSKLTIDRVDNYTDGITIQNSAGYRHLITAFCDGINPSTGSALQFKVANNSVGGNAPVMTLKGSGNVGIGTTSPDYKLHVQNAYCDGNTWYNASDKNLKKNFRSIAQESMLGNVMQLKIERWNYKVDQTGVDHIGPIAQDFNKIFALGGNDKSISTVDEIGVALAAIQELGIKMKKLEQLVQMQQELISSVLNSKSDESIQSKSDNGIELFQNNPNPFKIDTEIRMNVPANVNESILYLYDLQGKPLKSFVITGRGSTSVKLEGGSMTAGMYLYALIVDGKVVGVKKMILTE